VSNVEGGPRLCDVVVLDRAGRIFVSSDPKRFGIGRDASVLSSPLARAMAASVAPGESTVIDSKDKQEESSAIHTSLLSADQEPIGTLLMSYSHAVFAERYRETLKTLTLITTALVVLLLPLGWWLGHRLAAPMTRVTDALYQLGTVAARQSPLLSTREAVASDSEPRSEIARLEHSLDRLQVQLSEREELQRQFIAADRLAAIGRMTAGVAHEINNPLAGMLNALSNLRRDPGLLHKTVGLLERGLEQIRQTLTALLIETKTNARPLTPSDIEDLRLLVSSQAEGKNIALDWAYRVDQDLRLPAAPVRQIALNLLLNAVHASASRVEFDASVQGQELRLRVANDGKEFPQSQRQQPFTPAAGGEGHGLGLWASHQLVTSLGGSITLSSDAVRTEFEVRLPLQVTAKHAGEPIEAEIA
jgi:signal transduction histidine kinase